MFYHIILMLIFSQILNAFPENGPNVCVIEKIPGTLHNIHFDCKNWKSRSICGQKTILKYECCNGYSRIEGTQGCIKVQPLKNVLETARELGARKFVRYIEQSGIASQYIRDGAITLFAPNDQAMQVAEGNMRHFLERSTAQLDNLINYHTLNKRLTSDEFEADMMVNTRFAGNKIRLNKFSSWINTVNCVSITNKDNEASNGIVHIIDSVLNPDSSPQRNVADILLQDGRFTRFTYAMENTGISRALRRSKDAVTILAPTDNAFQKLQSSTLQNLLNDDKAGEALIKNHILPHTLCLPAVIGQHKLKAESNEKLSFNCSTKGVSIGQNITLKEFMTADNGVVYVIDEVMFPTRANNLLKLLEDEKLNTFLKLMKFTKVDETFEQAGDYTLFVPNEESMLNMDATKLKELMENRVKARQFVLHHAVQGKFKTQEIYDNRVIMTLDERNPIRFHINRNSIGVDGSIIEKSDKEGRNGILHVINKPLTVVDKDLQSLLQENSSFSIFREAVMKSLLRREIQIIRAKTIFVPINQAFLNHPQIQLDALMANTTYLNQIVQNHFLLNNFVTESSLQDGLFYEFPTANGNLEMFKNNNVITVNNITIIEPELITKNGIVHIINGVLSNVN